MITVSVLSPEYRSAGVKNMIKILIADDQELIRQSLQIVLNTKEDMEVIDTASNGQEVIQSIRKETPDVILMDIRMPKMDGVQCTKIIKENYPEIKIIILTTFDDDEFVYNALKFGASGYLLKGVSMEELCRLINSGLFTPRRFSSAAVNAAISSSDNISHLPKFFCCQLAIHETALSQEQ